MKYFKIVISFFFITQISIAQNSNRVFKNIKQTDLGLEINVNDGKYILTFINEKIVETTFIPQGEKLIENSHAVILKPKK